MPEPEPEPTPFVIRAIDWKDAEHMDLDWRHAFTVPREVRELIVASEDGTLAHIASLSRLAESTLGLRFPTNEALAPQPRVLQEQIIYLESGRGDLYMEVAVPGPASVEEIQLVRKKLDVNVDAECGCAALMSGGSSAVR